ncbi:pre-mRNA-splicing factor 38B isoform X2 [Diaphorina citri]|uniref:Pre-mRNA-splicing factor 38 n=1 Tax=Diaphorina citri TaxID=121845 RepID=A0A1S3DHI7_DIACI|nr:pre-mRNA-splicing factor 38B isoform X2 [Diaphorina citri]
MGERKQKNIGTNRYGMCGGVRGVGAGGIVSTAFCLLYKLFTLKMTRKQLNGLINHTDSPYIRGLGFMYIRYTQPPADLWDWYEPYLEDEEEVDVKAGGGQVMTIGNMLRSFLTKLEWHGTLFPRIPVPIQQKLEKQMSAKFPPVYSQAGSGNYQQGRGGGGNYQNRSAPGAMSTNAKHIPDNEAHYGEAERHAKTSGYSDHKKSDRGDSYKRSYDSKDDRYKSSSRYASPERKKYRDDSRDTYRDRDKYSSSSKYDKYSKDDRYSSSKDDRYSSREDKYSSSKEDRYSSRDKYSERSSRHSKDRDRSPRKHRRH